MLENEKTAWHTDFIEFLLNPMDNRSYQQFCEGAGISYQTLWRYRSRNKDVIEQEVKHRREEVYGAMRPIADKALLSKIKTDTNALKLFYQLAGDLIERSEVKSTENLTIEQKREKVASLLEALQKKQIIPNAPLNQTQLTQEQTLPVSDQKDTHNG